MKTNLKLLILSFSITIFFGACKKADNEPTPISAVDTTFVMKYDVSQLTINNSFMVTKLVADIVNKDLNEISGIASGHSVSKSLWVEEDSGNENKIYLISEEDGSQIAEFTLQSFYDRDWEDMSVAPGPTPTLSYIYLAETGDNKHSYLTSYIYRFPEPVITGNTFPVTGNINAIETIAFQYPDGIKNTEAVMIDPNTKDIYVISKEDSAVIYVAPYPQNTSSVFTVIKVGVLPINKVTAADISPDGNEILIKNYDEIFYWKKSGSESISKLLQQEPQKIPYTAEPQGESICWTNDGTGFITTSERPDISVALPVVFYKRE